MTDTATADPHTLLAALARTSVRLELNTYDLRCLAALHLRSEREGLTSAPDDLLIDLFEQVCDLVDTGAEQPRKRATRAIQRLLEQRLPLRIDAAGIANAGEYALASLATHIASERDLTAARRSTLGRVDVFDPAGLEPTERLPIARELGETSLCLLCHPTLSDAAVERTIEVVGEAVTRATR